MDYLANKRLLSDSVQAKNKIIRSRIRMMTKVRVVTPMDFGGQGRGAIGPILSKQNRPPQSRLRATWK